MSLEQLEVRDVIAVDDKTADVGDRERSTAEDEAADVGRGWMSRAMSQWPLIVVGLLLVAAAAGAAGLYFGQYRNDRNVNDAAAKSAIGAASDGTVAILSYAPDNLQRDLAAAKSHLTGDFLTYYSKFADQIVAPAAKEKAVNTKAAVKRTAIAELHPDAARVLVFLDQTTTSKDAPEPVQTASSVMVSLTRVRGVWLISAFDPT